MNKSKRTLFVILLLVLTIIILEFFKQPEAKNVDFPVKTLLSYEIKDDVSDIKIDLTGLNSNERVAKIVNREIMDIFGVYAQSIIESNIGFRGKYYVISETIVNRDIISLKIYREVEYSGKIERKIYAVSYDTTRDEIMNLSNILMANGYSYPKMYENARQFVLEKDGIADTFKIESFYFDKEGNIELVLSNSILSDIGVVWENMYIYKLSDADKKYGENLELQ